MRRGAAIPLAIAVLLGCRSEQQPDDAGVNKAAGWRAPVLDTGGALRLDTVTNDVRRPLPLVAAVAAFEQKHGETESPAYPYALADLDGDQRDDAVVLLSGPTWCGSGGCEMLVFRGMDNGFSFVSASSVTSEPVRVLSETAHGWRSLIVNSTGKGDVVLRFNGTGYPSNPSLEPQASTAQIAASRLVLALDTAGATTRTQPAKRTVKYVCDDKSELTIEFTGGSTDNAKVTQGKTKWMLPHVATGSGARYADKDVSVWNKGSGVLFERGDKTLNCAVNP